MIRNAFVAALLLATLASASAGPDQAPWWTPRRLVVCNGYGCQEAPDPYWEGPIRVRRPCHEWRQCYWRQRLW